MTGITVDGANGITLDLGFGAAVLAPATTAGAPASLTTVGCDLSIGAESGYALQIANFGLTGGINVNGSEGIAGQVLTSAGVGADAFWGSGDITIGTTNAALGSTQLTLAGLTSVTVTQDPVADLDLATKQYVDAATAAVNRLAPADCATTADITYPYTGLPIIDGFQTVEGSRVLIKNQTAQAQNGLYAATATGNWTYTTDAETWAQYVGATVFVSNGTVNINTSWIQTAPAGGTLDVTPMTWSQQSGLFVYTAGTGLSLTANQFANTGVLSAAVAAGLGLSFDSPTGNVTLQGTLSIAGGGTGLTAVGTNGQALIVSGGALAYGYPSQAANLTGGSAGSIPYQSGPSSTGFIATSTAGYLLTSTGVGTQPIWSNAATLLGAPPAIGSVTPNTGAFTSLSATQGGNTGSPLTINSTNTRGGAGYAEQIQFVNSNAGATNANKFLRMSPTGSLQLLNSGYTASLLDIADNGVIGIATGSGTTNNLTLNGQSKFYDDGNLHVVTNSPNIWLDSTSGVRIGFNGGATLIVSPTIGNSFMSFASIPQSSSASTTKALDNLNCQLASGGGTILVPQISAVSGSFQVYINGYYNKSGQALTGFTQSTATTISAGTWTTIPGLPTGTPDGRPSSGGDTVQVIITDITNSRTYRVHYIHGTVTTQGSITIERMA